jgi:hypothetical protein
MMIFKAILNYFPNFRALMSKCQNAAHPDTFGNYRESKVVQIKHHWLWKVIENIEN